MGRHYKNKPAADRQKTWRAANPERAAAIYQKWLDSVSIESRRKYNNDWMAKRRAGLVGPFSEEIDGPGWQEQNREHYLAEKRACTNRRRQEIRDEALRHYGGEVPACYCCGETHPKLLSLDHIFGGGTRERASTWNKTIAHAKKHKWPMHLRVACHSCNMGAYLNGGVCPHKEAEIS